MKAQPAVITTVDAPTMSMKDHLPSQKTGVTSSAEVADPREGATGAAPSAAPRRAAGTGSRLSTCSTRSGTCTKITGGF